MAAAQPVERQQAMIKECFMLISKRSDRVCNFLEDVGAWSKDTKLGIEKERNIFARHPRHRQESCIITLVHTAKLTALFLPLFHFF